MSKFPRPSMLKLSGMNGNRIVAVLVSTGTSSDVGLLSVYKLTDAPDELATAIVLELSIAIPLGNGSLASVLIWLLPFGSSFICATLPPGMPP